MTHSDDNRSIEVHSWHRRMDRAVHRHSRYPEMDAFPATDIGLLRGAAALDKSAVFTSRLLLDRAESWRPWRAYAAQHLWATDPSLLPEKGQIVWANGCN